MGYIIGSFNIREFTGVGKHDLGIIANIILGEHFDIVALQEVFKQKALDYLKMRLPGWEACYRRTGNGRAGDYGLGFLWNTRRFRECSKDNEPISFENYKSKIRMRRNPCYGRFTPSGLIGGTFFEIRLIDVHLWWGSPRRDDVAQRITEYKLVTDKIHDYINAHKYGYNRNDINARQQDTKMPVYTIVLGDYNLCCFKCQENEIQNQKVKTKQSEKTTLSTDNASFANDYDHFSYDEDRFNGTNVIIKRVNSVCKYCGNDFEEHREKVSDHVPIKLELIL
jgi:endonuclease/exonuclease/phosphatase family metal-dependent hydrolase